MYSVYIFPLLEHNIDRFFRAEGEKSEKYGMWHILALKLTKIENFAHAFRWPKCILNIPVEVCFFCLPYPCKNASVLITLLGDFLNLGGLRKCFRCSVMYISVQGWNICTC